MRILAVDDDAQTRLLLTDFLRKGGYDVETAADGSEALAVIRARRPDLVVLDAVMPGLDGFAVLAELRRMEDAPPVLGLTAISDHEAFARFLYSGAVAYLCKPVSLQELLNAVRLTLRVRKGPQAGMATERRPEARMEYMVGVRAVGVPNVSTLIGELRDATPEEARVILMVPLEVGSAVRVVLHESIAGRRLGFDAIVTWCAAGPTGFSHGFGGLQASKEAWDHLLALFATPAAST